MSESMAFIGGVAVAGLAALLLLKGGNPIPTNFAVPSQVPAPVMQQPALMQPGTTYPGVQNPNPFPGDPNSNQLRLDNDRQKIQLENLQQQNEQLKAQNQQLQSLVQAYGVQLQHNAALQQSQSPWWSSGIIWAVGGMALTIGGGVVVAGVTNLFSPKQRPTRTVQVIHPYNGPTPPLAPVRRAEFLPPRTEVRRTEAAEYEDMY